jgi:23S rRNA pseudouridine1911/1915/1917 synthase
MPKTTAFDCHIAEECAGMRLDQALARMRPEYSRTRLQQWIKSGYLRVDGVVLRPRDPVVGGEWVCGTLPDAEECRVHAQDLPLEVHYEDEDLLVINKPAGLVVHPATGNPDGTLVNALLHYAPELAALPRAGLVHRLDKDTSGLLVVARSLRAHSALVEQLQTHTLERVYEAVAVGVLTAGGTVAAPIGRHPVDRQRMAVVSRGKPAISHYRVIKRFRAHTWLRIQLETGRTHQIRVHMAYLRYPLLGDRLYGARPRIPPGATRACAELLRGFSRQALHAIRLSLTHPATSKRLSWQVELPQDMAELLKTLHIDLDTPLAAKL